MAEAFQYAQSYRLILDYLLQFALSRIFDEVSAATEYPQTRGGLTGFVICDLVGKGTPQVGDLVLLDAMRDVEYRLCWLKDIQLDQEHGFHKYLCESLQTGQQCWWSSIGIKFLHRHTLNQHPEWRWTNEQHDFQSRWFQACANQGAYVYRPLMPDFLEDGMVIIGTRTMFSQAADYRARHYLANWQDTTVEQLEVIYQNLVKDHEQHLKNQQDQ
jgi:hypothetical protein